MADELEQPASAPAAPPVQTAVSSAADTFLGKLKEQSFSILVMVAVVYYQHTLWQADRSRMELDLQRKGAQVDAMVVAERERLLDREKYLMNQRDQFIEMLKEQAALGRVQERARR
jgi:hypothetical protein